MMYVKCSFLLAKRTLIRDLFAFMRYRENGHECANGVEWVNMVVVMKRLFLVLTLNGPLSNPIILDAKFYEVEIGMTWCCIPHVGSVFSRSVVDVLLGNQGLTLGRWCQTRAPSDVCA